MKHLAFLCLANLLILSFVSKYDAAGNFQWTRQLVTSGNNESFGVSADGLGNVCISGFTGGSLGGPNAGFNDAGQTAFAASLIGSGVDSTNNQGIWSEGSSSLALLARTGSQAPGAPSGVNYSSFSNPVINNAGRTAFLAGLTGSGVDATNNTGIWSEGSGYLALVVRRTR